jgi:site-specific DNA recombinase
VPDSADVEDLLQVFLRVGRGQPPADTIDPAKGMLVRRLFELYATGRYNLHSLKDEAQKSGLRNRRER